MADTIDNLPLLDDYMRTAQAPIEKAHSLPFGVYRAPEIHQLEMDRIFKNEWVFVVSEQELPNIGDYFSFTLANEPLVVLRGKDNQIRVLSNLCRHRGTPLLDEGFGTLEKHIVCPYHAWAYQDDGHLKAAPLTGDAVIDKESHCLPQYHLDSWHGLLFVHLGKTPIPLNQRLQGIDDYLGHFDLSSFKYGYRSTELEHWQSNWKLAMENAMESYHLFKVHKETLETVTPTRKAFDIAGSSEWSLTGGEMKDTTSKVMKWLQGNHPEVFNNYILISIPPSFVGILTYDSLAWVQVLPLDEKNTLVRSAGISPIKTSAVDKAEKNFVEAFFEEDKVICERVQKGMNSTLTRGGKLVSMERIVADFHQFLGSRLFNTPVSPFYQAPEADLFLNSKNTDE